MCILCLAAGQVFSDADDFEFNELNESNDADFGDFADFDDFGGGGDAGVSKLPWGISGEVSAAFLGYAQEFKTREYSRDASLGDVFSGKLNFKIEGTWADGFINLDLQPSRAGTSSGAGPVAINEAYLRAYFGDLNVEAGIRKLVWGRADSLGPMDVVNPLDYSDLTSIADPLNMKIARPMLHTSWNISNEAKLEGVFEPGFQGHRLSLNDRWRPMQINALASGVGQLTAAKLSPLINTGIGTGTFDQAAYDQIIAKTSADSIVSNYTQDAFYSMRYAQAGLRFTSTINGSVDVGVQYFYGNLFRPSVDVSGIYGLSGPQLLAALNAGDTDALYKIRYTKYQQAGLDTAFVLAGFNLRAEAAINVTEDTRGDKGAVENPFFAYSFGFDRDLFLGINANIQANGSVRLFHDKLNDNPLLDTEAGKEQSSTRLTLILSKSFLRDELELKATGLWDIETEGFYIVPAINWTKDDISIEVTGGIFGGDKEDELGYYWRNKWVKAALTFSY
ncbi:hypothetical protein ACYULU_13780 [Breznakiellaceae bacterium SP9]